MKVFGITGGTAADKLALIERLLPALSARGISVSMAKFMDHAFDVDRPGKDSYSHRQAGATEVIVLSERRWALMHENRGKTGNDLESLLARMTPVDLVLSVGFHEASVDKLEIVRNGTDRPLRCVTDSRIVGLAVDQPVKPVELPDPAPEQLAIDDGDTLAAFIIDRCGLLSP